MGILELDCVLEDWKNGRFRPSEICSGAAGERSVQIERGRPGGAGGDGFPPCRLKEGYRNPTGFNILTEGLRQIA